MHSIRDHLSFPPLPAWLRAGALALLMLGAGGAATAQCPAHKINLMREQSINKINRACDADGRHGAQLCRYEVGVVGHMRS